MSASSAQIVYSGAALLCAAIGSVFDVRERRIPNAISGTGALAGLMLHGVLGGWSQLGSSTIAGLVGFGVFLVFYLAGGMGAGDVKLMAAVGCLEGLSTVRLALIATAVAGAIFAFGLAIRRRRFGETMTNVASIVAHHGQEGLTPHPSLNLRNTSTVRLPFALPIAAGCLAPICSALWGG